MEDALRTGLILASHGTGDPGENREIAGHLAGKRVAYLDAPVSGGGAGARARTLTTMAGGDRTAYHKCEPVFARSPTPSPTWVPRAAARSPSSSTTP